MKAASIQVSKPLPITLRHILPRSLKAQLVLLTSTCLVLSILGYGYRTAQEQTRAAKRTVSAQLGALAQNLATVSSHFLLTNEPDQIEALIEQTATVSFHFQIDTTLGAKPQTVQTYGMALQQHVGLI